MAMPETLQPSHPENRLITQQLAGARDVFEKNGIELTQNQLDQIAALSTESTHDFRVSGEDLVRQQLSERLQEIEALDEASQYIFGLIDGAEMLEGLGSETLTAITDLSDSDFKALVADLLVSMPQFLAETGVSDIKQLFEHIRSLGKARVLIWNFQTQEYEELEMNEEQKQVLPWGGTIKIGGLEPGITDTFQIMQNSDYQFDPFSLSINGVLFSR